MSIQLTCPSGHTLTVSESWAGRAGRCPVCKALVEVPACANVESRMLVPTMNGKAVTIDSRSLSCSETSPKSAPSNAAAASAPTHKSAPPALSAQITRTLSVTPSDRVTAPITVATQQASVSTPPPISVPPPLPLNVKLFGSPPPLPTSQALKTDRAHQEAVDRMVLEIGQAPPLLPNRIAPEARTETVRATVAPESEIAGKGAANQGATLPVSLSNAATSRPRAGYQPDADKLRGVYSLAVAMALFGFFCMVPALRHWNLGSAPNWARAALLTSLLQWAFAAWVVSIPDWATLRSAMIFYTIVAAMYGLTMTIALTTPLEKGLPLDLTDVRREAVLWCCGVILLAFLLAYFCGRAAWRWRKMFELLHA